MTPCPHCGTSLPVQVLRGTKIQIEGSCPNDWCPNPERATKKRQETTRVIASSLLILLIGAGLVGWYSVLEKVEQRMEEDCQERGGQWAPVRGILNLPTGTGTCVERLH